MSGRFEFLAGRCTACGACVVACMDENDVDLHAGDRPFRRCLTREEADGAAQYLSLGCMHCADAPCIAVCPRGCITRDGATGLVLCDSTRCIGCRRCERACPSRAPVFGPDGRMRKCDGCIDRVRAALAPACVRACPFDALRFTGGEAEPSKSI